MIFLNDFKRMDEAIHAELMTACDRVFKSGWYILGDEVRRFEQQLQEYVGSKWATGCGNGMDAIEIGLRIAGIKAGDKVITTPLTAFATALAIHRAGGIPVYVDVDPCGLIDLDKVECLLQRDSTIRFMVPVHLFGIPLNLVQLRKLRQKHHLVIIEDCAQAIGAKYQHHLVGSVGEIAAISFYPTKNLGAIGDAGALWGNRKSLKAKADTWRNYGQLKKYVHSEVGLNSRLDELQAALLCSQLTHHLDEYTKRRQEIAAIYLSQISNPLVRVLPVSYDATPVWHLFPVLVKKCRAQFMDYCTSNGVQTGIHYPVLSPLQKGATYFDAMQVDGPLTQALAFARTEVSLPIHPYMSDAEIATVVEVVNNWQPVTERS